MQDIIDQLHDDLRSAWRFRWVGLIAAVVVAVVGWAVVFALPDRYEAKTVVFVDTRTALKPVLQGLTMEQDVNVQLNYVRQSLFSGEQLERLARDTGVLGDLVLDPRKKAGILDDFSKRFVVDVRAASGRENERDSGGSLYTFSYQDPKRDRSLKVMETVVKTFIEETLGGKREGATNAQQFLETQLKSYELRLRQAENRLADFKKTNVGLMPTEQGGYFTQLQTEMDAAKKAENDLAVAQTRRAELGRQLRGETVVTATSMNSPTAGGLAGGGDTLSRVKEAQARLDEMLLRYTEKHPDVLAARATLTELQRRREVEVESLRRGDANAVASSGISSNPVYQSIQLQINQADVDIASLRGQLSQHRGKAAELKQRLDSAPKVEAEAAQLNRDYDINKAQYSAMLANYEKARLGEQADNAGSVRFEVVQPPTAGYGPVSPKRSLLLAGVLALAFGAGGGLCYLLTLLRPVVSSTRGLSELTELPVLGVVSAAFPQQLHAQARRDLFGFVTAAGGLVFVFVIVFALNWAGFRLALGASGAG
jgi:polysaccharide chain length determinant protein (PEP-CTERM system associated)